MRNRESDCTLFSLLTGDIYPLLTLHGPVSHKNICNWKIFGEKLLPATVYVLGSDNHVLLGSGSGLDLKNKRTKNFDD